MITRIDLTSITSNATDIILLSNNRAFCIRLQYRSSIPNKTAYIATPCYITLRIRIGQWSSSSNNTSYIASTPRHVSPRIWMWQSIINRTSNATDISQSTNNAISMPTGIYYRTYIRSGRTSSIHSSYNTANVIISYHFSLRTSFQYISTNIFRTTRTSIYRI